MPEVALSCDYGFFVGAYTFIILFKCYEISATVRTVLVWKYILFCKGVFGYQSDYIWVYSGSFRGESSSCQKYPFDIVVQAICIWSCSCGFIIPHNLIKGEPIPTRLWLHKVEKGIFQVHQFHFLGEAMLDASSVHLLLVLYLSIRLFFLATLKHIKEGPLSRLVLSRLNWKKSWILTLLPGCNRMRHSVTEKLL